MSSADLQALGLRAPGDPPGLAGSSPDDLLTKRDRLRAWAGAHRASLALAGTLLAVVAVVHAWGASHSPAVTDDEGTYMAQAWAVQVHHSLAPYTYWYDHPPLAWLQISTWTWATGAFSAATHAVDTGRRLMVVASVASAGLLYILARRLEVRRAIAALVVALFALSPLAVHYQRLVLLDNLAVPWLLAAMVLGASPRRSLWAASGAGACLAVAVLSKETFVLFGPALAALVWLRSDPRTRAFCLTGFGATFLLLLAGYPLYAVLKGELLPGAGHVSLWRAVQFQLFTRQASGRPWSPSSVAHATVAGWLHLDPWLLGVGAGALPIAVALRWRRSLPVAAALAVPALTALRGGYLPDPFVVGLLPFAALSAGLALDGLTGRAAGPHGRGGSHGPTVTGGRAALGAGLALAVVAGLAPGWAQRDRALAAADDTAPVWQAEAWVERHVAPDQRLIVDDSLWVDLVDHGFDPHLGVVWFYKLDDSNNLDPSVARALPQGWRDFGYIVSTPVIRSALAAMPGRLRPVRQALAASTVVASFGTAGGAVEVRRIHTALRTTVP